MRLIRAAQVGALFFFSACSSTIRITTDPPGADIRLTTQEAGSSKPLATTPFSGSPSDLLPEGSEGVSVVTLSKEGFDDFSFAIPDLESADLDLKLELKQSTVSSHELMNRIIRMSFRAQSLILEKNFEEALELASQMERISPKLRSIFHIRGTVFFLNNQLAKSRVEWEKALEVDSSDVDAGVMLKRVVTAQSREQEEVR